MDCAFCHNLIGTGDRAAFNPAAGPGVAVREFPLRSGFADYLLLVDRKVPGVVEAKREGTPLSGRYSYDKLVARDKVNLDIFWLRDEGIAEGDTLLDPDVLAAAIVEDLAAALEQFREIAADLEYRGE